jgi:hypothetical protein
MGGGHVICALHANQSNRRHEFDHLPPHHYLHRSNTSMDLRKTFLKPFKKAKQKLTESHRKRDGRSGSEGDREGKGTDVEGGSETGQKNPRLHSEVESVVESGPSREGNDVGGDEVGQVDPPTSTPSISHGREPDSM